MNATENYRQCLSLLELVEMLENILVGKGGLEPPRLAAHGPKPCPSASSGTPPNTKSYRMLTGNQLPCNAYTPRRIFASNLHRTGMDTEPTMP